MSISDLISKYNTEGPRYTSYPTVPFWENQGHDQTTWISAVQENFNENHGDLSLYLHLPFCERLCSYCGCTTHITKNHDVEEEYIDFLLKEWNIYLNSFEKAPILKELHLGGGTPTFFRPTKLERLITSILDTCKYDDEIEMGFEGHPNNTTEEHLRVLYDLGFRRVSFGIQDFDGTVQKTINRKQSVEDVVRVTDQARKIGYSSINYDLVYGLPRQTLETLEKTIDKTNELKPDRIAFYGYAHIPKIKRPQRRLESFLPSSGVRLEMYKLGKKMLKEGGYRDIGMDHFSLPGEALLVAKENGTLHRNFMGYTTRQTSLLLGLGMSSIGDSWTAFSQNEKTIKSYYTRLSQNELPILRGHQLTKEDLLVRKLILDLMCTFQAKIPEDLEGKINKPLLDDLVQDELVQIDRDFLHVTEKGVPFIRNICMAYDVRLNLRKGITEVFSKVI